MTLESLRKTIQERQKLEDQEEFTNEDSPQMRALINRCYRIPFYHWNKKISDPEPINCKACFNCVIGLPTKILKDGTIKQFPLFDYERLWYRAMTEPGFLNARSPTTEEERYFNQMKVDAELKSNTRKESVHVAHSQFIKERANTLIHKHKVSHTLTVKSTGLGLTELCLRYICWKCIKDDKLKGSDVIILTGIRQELSNDLILRMKQFFTKFGITFDTRNTTLHLNGVRIRAFPAENVSAIRGLPHVSIIYADEISYFSTEPSFLIELDSVLTRYAGKSSAEIIMTTTPNKVGDYAHNILSQPWDKSFFKILKLSYEWGIGKIYTEDDIRIAKASNSFEREYNLSFTHSQGNSFSKESIDKAVELGKKYDPVTINKETDHSLGVDPGFGSSSFGLVCLEHSDSIIKVVAAEVHERSSFASMLQRVWEIKNEVGILNNVYIDGANVEFVEAVKQDMGENSNWQYIHDKLNWAKKNKLRIENYMKVIPVSFSQEGPKMLVHCRNILDHEDNLIAINPKWDKLITALRGAVSQDYKLLKTESPYSDLTDAFRLAMKYFTLER